MIGSYIKHALFLRRERRLKARRSELPDGGSSLSVGMDSDSRTLLLAFGGLAGRIAIPPFEFLRLTGDVPVKRLFVRDLHEAWYHKGMPGYDNSLLGCADALRDMIAEHDVDRMVFAGNSSGGYAALVFGTLLGADTVLCFAPQTTLDLGDLAAMGDHRWDSYLKPLFAEGAIDPAWVDLSSALPAARHTATRYQVYVDESLAVDREHADRLSGLEGLRMYRFGRGDHQLVRDLRDSGALARILSSALELPSGGGAPQNPAALS